MPFQKGHTINLGRKMSSNTKQKIGSGRLNENNPSWRGDKVGYDALHAWVKRKLTKPLKCENCHIISKLDLANISQKYKRELTDWEWICRRCHMLKDGRMKNLKQFKVVVEVKTTN